MALKSDLGFGMMRLPVNSDNPTDINFDELNQMVDEYIDAGYKKESLNTHGLGRVDESVSFLLS